MPEEISYRSQSVNYLGFLEAKLRDLRGIATLVYELVQNADDAKDEAGKPSATRISFEICDDALIVENDGVFREIDFERMQDIASGGKRDEADTTGAFGIGFISVYQITDSPEIFSAGRHWKFRPEADEEHRIEERRQQTQGTRFYLPWAFDPQSAVRQKLRLEAVKPENLKRYRTEIMKALPMAALFLKNVKELELRESGMILKHLKRESADEYITIEGSGNRAWRILDASFELEANRLRSQYPRQIEAKRHARVRIAVPDEAEDQGRLFAVLPSETTVPLPFHIDADFFPSSDRKRILFDFGYQGEWNRAAIRAAAKAVASHLLELRELLVPRAFWQFLNELRECERKARSNEVDEVFRSFWECIVPLLPENDVIYTTDRKWIKPSQAHLLEQDSEIKASSLFESLGISVVHPDLRPYFGLLRQAEIGTKLLTVSDICQALKRVGLDRPVALHAAPAGLTSSKKWSLLWDAIQAALERTSSWEKSTAQASLSSCAIALNQAQVLYPPHGLRRGDTIARRLFTSVSWVDPSLPANHIPGSLVSEFGLKDALQDLETRSAQLDEQWRAGSLKIIELYEWFQGHRSELNSKLIDQLKRLPLWPASGRLCPLTEVYIPGDFTNPPLKLATLIDLELLGGQKEFLQHLGARELTFQAYVRECIPNVFASNPDLSVEARRLLIRFLAQRLGEIRGDESIRHILAQLNLVECLDGGFHPAGQVYFQNDLIGFLAGEVPLASFQDQSEGSVRPLYEWLGVAVEVRAGDILKRVDALGVPDETSIKFTQAVFDYLAAQWPKWDEAKRSEYRPLVVKAWLPARKNKTRFHRPEEIYAEFRDYLFETQADFLSLPRPLQNRASAVGLSFFLGLRSEPDVPQVVRHLLACSKDNRSVNREIYTYLTQNHTAPVIQELRNKAWLFLPEPNQKYVYSNQVFWRENPFGTWRYLLGSELRVYEPLFNQLGVRETPLDGDYLEVLKEIADTFGTASCILDEQAYAIVMECWRHLSEGLDKETLKEDLSQLRFAKVIPNAQRLLTAPNQIFIEDRVGLKAKFSPFLDNNVIIRPQGAWKAMVQAGVQLLSQAVEVNLVEPSDETVDEVLDARIEERRPLIDRVIESVKAGDPRSIKENALDELEFLKAKRLISQYRLSIDGTVCETPTESIPALLLAREGELLSVHTDHDLPWLHISRELAYANRLEGEIGPLASGLEKALSVPSFEEAEQALDALNYPRIEAKPGTQVIVGATIGQVGGEGAPEGGQTPTVPPVEGGTVGGGGTPEGLGGGGGGGTGPGGGSVPPGIPPGSGRARPRKTQRPRYLKGKLRTYVLSDEDGEDSDRKGPNPEVDRAGIRHVLEYEELHDREAAEMGHNNEGYDVVSRDAAGNLRYIEVKSLSNLWSEHDPAALSRPQFDTGVAKQDNFWLYIVEGALSSEWHLYGIQNPVGRVNQFLYDDGWKNFVEEEANSQSILEMQLAKEREEMAGSNLDNPAEHDWPSANSATDPMTDEVTE